MAALFSVSLSTFKNFYEQSSVLAESSGNCPFFKAAMLIRSGCSQEGQILCMAKHTSEVFSFLSLLFSFVKKKKSSSHLPEPFPSLRESPSDGPLHPGSFGDATTVPSVCLLLSANLLSVPTHLSFCAHAWNHDLTVEEHRASNPQGLASTLCIA